MSNLIKDAKSIQIDSSEAKSPLHEITIRMKVWPLAKAFAAIISVIVVVGALANYAVYNIAPTTEHPIADVLKRFDLGHEPSIPALYSSVVMLMTAAFLSFLGVVDGSVGGQLKRGWYLLAALFLCLAIDEAVMFHEMATAALDKLNLSGPFYFSWVIPGALFAGVIGLISLRFLWSLDMVTRRWMILSGIVFLAGAIGMELIAGVLFAAAESEEAAISSVAHVLVQAVEEGLEMAGVAIFFCALVHYAQSKRLSVVVYVDSTRVRPRS